MKIEKPDILKLTIGIVCFIVSARINLFLFPPEDPGNSNLFFVIPGLLFGLAMVLPNLADIEGLKWKLVSVLLFPLITVFIWFYNFFITFILGAMIGSLFNSEIIYKLAMGFVSPLVVFIVFNLFFTRKIKLANYIIVGSMGLLSFLIIDLFFANGFGWGNHVGSLIFIWQILVGIGIAITFKKEKLIVILNKNKLSSILRKCNLIRFSPRT